MHPRQGLDENGSGTEIEILGVRLGVRNSSKQGHRGEEAGEERERALIDAVKQADRWELVAVISEEEVCSGHTPREDEANLQHDLH